MVLLAIGLCLVYGIVLIGLQKLSGVRYNELPDTESNLRRGGLVPVSIAGLMLVIALAVTGRLGAAFTYTPRETSPFLWLIPLLFVVGAALRLRRTPWRTTPARFAVMALATSLVVGVSEELLVRGYLVDVLRDQGMQTITVALLSSLVFGVIHGLNALNGQDITTTLLQIGFSSVVGLGLFAALAVSGTLWLPILLHALFDFSILIQGKIVDKGGTSRAEAVVTVMLYLASIASLFFV